MPEIYLYLPSVRKIHGDILTRLSLNPGEIYLWDIICMVQLVVDIPPSIDLTAWAIISWVH